MFSIFNLLKKKKLNFSLIREKKILNFDPTLNLDYLNNSIFTYQYNQIYAFYAFKALILLIFNFFLNKKIKLKDLYFKQICSRVNPRVAIGNEIRQEIFKLKKFFPNVLSICFQMSLYRSEHRSLSKKRLNGKKVDYFLTYDSWHSSFFSFLDAKFIEVGSVKSNSILKKEQDLKYDILFISQFRDNGYMDPINYYYLSSTLMQSNSYYVFKLISEYAKKSSKKLAVSLASNRKDKKNKINKQNEIKFFKSINNNFHFDNFDGHEMASKANLIISLDSTLSIELLYKGFKVLIINPTSFFGKVHIFENKQSDGFCWVNDSSKEKIFSKIDNLLSISIKQFDENLKNEKIKKFYEERNFTLTKIINNHLKSI